MKLNIVKCEKNIQSSEKDFIFFMENQEKKKEGKKYQGGVYRSETHSEILI